MTIEQLKIFLGIAATNSFSETAEELYIGQSSISKKVQALEDELGSALFIRKSRKVELSGSGRVFYSYATTIMDAYEQMLQKMEPFVRKERPSLKVSSLALLSAYSLLTPLRHFFADRLDADINITERISLREVLQDFHSNDYSISIFFEDFVDKQTMKFIPILEDQFVCVFKKDYWLEEHETISLNMLKNEKFIMPFKGEFFQDRLIARCKSYKFIPDLLPMDLRLNTILDVVSDDNDHYVTLCYKGCINSLSSSELSFRTLNDIPPVRLGFVFDTNLEQNNPDCYQALKEFPTFYRSIQMAETSKRTLHSDF